MDIYKNMAFNSSIFHNQLRILLTDIFNRVLETVTYLNSICYIK